MDTTTTQRGQRGGRGRGTNGRGRARGGGRGRGDAAANNGSIISVVSEQPFETLSTEEQEMIKYLHRASKNSKSTFSRILNDTAATTTAGPPNEVSVLPEAVSAPSATPGDAAISSTPAFTLPPKRKKRDRDDDDDEDEYMPPKSAVVAAPIVLTPQPQTAASTSIISKWRSQLQALAPPSLPMEWLPNVQFVQATQSRFLAHRSRIAALRSETVEAITYFHDYLDARKRKESAASTAFPERHEGTLRLPNNSPLHHRSVSEASGSKYSSVPGDAEGGAREGGPSQSTLEEVRLVYDFLMRDGELDRIFGDVSMCGSWTRMFSQAQREDIAAAAASIAVRVPHVLAPAGHPLVSMGEAEATEGLSDVEVAMGLVPVISYFPLQQSPMAMWFRCLTTCIGTTQRPPALPLMTMFALAGDGDTNNLLHAVLGVLLNGAAGKIANLPSKAGQAHEANDDNDDVVRPGKGLFTGEDRPVVEAESADDTHEAGLAVPTAGVESLLAHTAAASVNTLIARMWRETRQGNAPSNLGVVDQCVVAMFPSAAMVGDEGTLPSTPRPEVDTLIEALRFAAQLLPLGFRRHQSQAYSPCSRGVGEWVFAAFAAAELPLDPQGDLQMQKLYRLTVRSLHALHTAAAASHKRGVTEELAASHSPQSLLTGFLILVCVGGDSCRCIEEVAGLYGTELENLLAGALDRVISAMETVLVLLCKVFILHNRDLVPI